MKMKLLSVLALSLAIAGAASAQITTPEGSKSDQTLLKIHKLDLVSKILPLALNKEQYSDLLLAIEEARKAEKDQLQKEDAVLAALDAQVSDALDAALNKDTYPPRDLQSEISAKANSMGIRRTILMTEITENVYNAISKSFNAGQIKVMAGTFDDRFVDSNAKKGGLTDETKTRFFIRDIFLDPLAYQLIVDLAKTASSGKEAPKTDGSTGSSGTTGTTGASGSSG